MKNVLELIYFKMRGLAELPRLFHTTDVKKFIHDKK